MIKQVIKMKTLTLKSSVKLLLVLAFIFLPMYLNAQEDEAEKQSNNCSRNISTAGSPFVLTGTQVYGRVGFLWGARGEIIFNNTFSIGVACSFLFPTRRVNCPMPDHEGRHRLSGMYGGLFFGHTLSSNSPRRVTGDMLIGLGGMTWGRREDRSVWSADGYTLVERGFRHPRSLFMVLEPRIAIELLGDDEAGIWLSISYRYCPFFRLQYGGVDVVPRTAFNGFSVSLAFIINSR